MKMNIYSKITVLVFTLLTLNLGIVTAQNVPELMYYKFNASGSQANFASSPVGTNPATLSGLTIGSTGQFGTALIGNGLTSTSNSLNTGWNLSLPSTGWTISFWLNNFPASSASTSYYFGETSTSFRCFTGGVAGNGNLWLRGTGITDVPINAIPSTPTVIHLVYNGSAILAYKNGVLVNTVTQTTAGLTGTSPLLIGGYSSSASFTSGTLMDEFRLYNRALTATEITATYNQSLPMGGNAGITAIIVPGDTVCSSSQPVKVMVKNYNTSSLDSVRINWKVNNVNQPIFYWNGSLAAGNTTEVVIGNYNFLTGTTYNIVVATSNPNGNTDLVPSNDTLTRNSIFVKTGPTFTPSSLSYTSCYADSVYLNGTITGIGFFDIKITNGVDTFTYLSSAIVPFSALFTPLFSATYKVIEISDSTLCSNYSTPLINFTVYPKPVATITTTSDTIFCMGDTAVLNANTGVGYIYQWKKNALNINGATSNTYNALNSGLYSFMLTDSNSCKSNSRSMQVIANPNPIVFLGNDTNIAMSKSITLNAGSGFSNYLWSTGAITQTIIGDTTGHGLGPKTYSVLVTDANGCKGGDTIIVTYTTNPGIAGISSNEILITPNPVKDKFRIQSVMIDPNSNIQIFDANGKLIYSGTMNSQSTEISVADWSRGLYLIRIQSDNYNITKKLIVE